MACMYEINKRFNLPKEEQKFKDTIKRIESCDITSRKMSEHLEGPEIEETYMCPCGDIILRQKSVITNVDNPENGHIETVHMKSDGCVLQ